MKKEADSEVWKSTFSKGLKFRYSRHPSMTARKVLVNIHFCRICNYRGKYDQCFHPEGGIETIGFSFSQSSVPVLPQPPKCWYCMRLHSWPVGLTFEREALADWEESHVSEVLGHSVWGEKVPLIQPQNTASTLLLRR